MIVPILPGDVDVQGEGEVTLLYGNTGRRDSKD